MTIPFLDLNFAGIFDFGQAYVALSRATDLEGLILRNFDASLIKTNAAVINFYKSIGFDPLKPCVPKSFKHLSTSNIVITNMNELIELFTILFDNFEMFGSTHEERSNESILKVLDRDTPHVVNLSGETRNKYIKSEIANDGRNVPSQSYPFMNYCSGTNTTRLNIGRRISSTINKVSHVDEATQKMNAPCKDLRENDLTKVYKLDKLNTHTSSRPDLIPNPHSIKERSTPFSHVHNSPIGSRQPTSSSKKQISPEIMR